MTAKMFKFSENMTIDVATKLTTDLYDYFKHESLEDIALMLKMARTGQLGSGKGRLDSDTLFNVFIPKYLELKAEEREKEHRRNKSNFAQVKMSEESFEKFNAISEKLRINKESKKAEEVVPVVNHHQIYMNKLKAGIPKLTDKQLEDNLKNLLASGQEIFKEAIKIIQTEIDTRKKNGENSKIETEET